MPILPALIGAFQYSSGVPAFGYVAGGSFTAITDKWDLSDDSRTTLADALDDPCVNVAGVSHYNVAGYAVGGYTTGWAVLLDVQKVTYATDATSVTSNALSGNWSDSCGMSNSPTAGYLSGAWTGAVNSTAIKKLTYSGETLSTISATLSQEGYSSAQNVVTKGVAGYHAGGNPGGSSVTDRIEKLTFSGETTSTLSAVLATAVRGCGGMSNNAVAGYIFGSTAPATNTIQKLTFSTEAIATLGITLSTTRSEAGGFAQAGVAGYCMGDSGYTACNKIDFSDDTISTLSSGLSTARYQYASLSNDTALA